VWSRNAQRRDLKSGEQRAAIFVTMKPEIAKEIAEKIKAEANAKRSEAAKEQHKVSNPRIGETKSGAAAKSGSTRKPPEHKQADAMAEAAGVNRGAIERQEALRKHRPDLADKVAQGKINAATAKKRFDRERRAETIAKAAEEAKLDSDRVTLHLGTCFSLTKLLRSPASRRYLHSSTTGSASRWRKRSGFGLRRLTRR
jgi:hypothetical protein